LTEPPPLGVYIHWPYCARICPYCDFNVVRDRGKTAEQTDLADAIVADLIAQRALTGPRRLLSIFFGGGTPSLMDPAQVARVIDTANRCGAPPTTWRSASRPIRPTPRPAASRPWRRRAWRACPWASSRCTTTPWPCWAATMTPAPRGGRSPWRPEAFPRLSIDLIYARPDQTADAWRAELEEALAMGPEHVSPYQLTIEAGTAFDRAVGRGKLIVPDEDRATTLFETTQAVLEAPASTPTRSPTTPRARRRARGTISSIGVATTMSASVPAPMAGWPCPRAARHHRPPQDRRLCRRRARDRRRLRARVAHPTEAAEERLLLGLRIDDGVAFDEVAVLGLSADAEKVRQFVALGLLADDPRRLRASRAGRLVLDRLTGALAT
jgi:coproporphyrinogen III oxidase-like Fe-S oxidoreductase